MRVSGTEFFTALGDAARLVGTAKFHPSLLHLLGGLVRSHTRLVMRYSRFAAPDFLVNEGLPQYVVDLYLSGYYRFDPFYHYWREHGRCGVISLREVISPALAESDYFSVFAPKARISDDLGMFLPGIGGAAIALFLERRTGRFSTTDVARLRLIYPAILGLHKAHLSRLFLTLASDVGGASWPETPGAVLLVDRTGKRVFVNQAWRDAEAANPELERAIGDLSPGHCDRVALAGGAMLHVEPLDADFPLAPNGKMHVLEVSGRRPIAFDYGQAVARFLPPELTPREREIVRLILASRSTEAIAKSLGIGKGTVKNHRRRLYYKLDITSERELFALFLDYLAGTDKRLSPAPDKPREE